jgi:hypothetical protein
MGPQCAIADVGRIGIHVVMPGLLPGIHVLLRQQGKTWMAGSSQACPGHDEEKNRA